MKWLLFAGVGAAAYFLLRAGSTGTETVPVDLDMDKLKQAATQQWPSFQPDDFYLDVYGNQAELWAGTDIVTTQLLDRMPIENLRAYFNI